MFLYVAPFPIANWWVKQNPLYVTEAQKRNESLLDTTMISKPACSGVTLLLSISSICM